MRQLGASIGLGAMLVVVLTAPLFHMHERDEHGHAVSFVHAHLAEFEVPDSHSQTDMEDEDSHTRARFVDVFTFDAFSLGFDWPVDVHVHSPAPMLEAQGNIVTNGAPPAHGPPAVLPTSPRSPPAL